MTVAENGPESQSDVGQAAEVEHSRQTILREVGRLDFQYFPDRLLLQTELHAGIIYGLLRSYKESLW